MTVGVQAPTNSTEATPAPKPTRTLKGNPGDNPPGSPSGPCLKDSVGVSKKGQAPSSVGGKGGRIIIKSLGVIYKI